MSMAIRENVAAWTGGILCALCSMAAVVFLTFKLAILDEQRSLAELADRVFLRSQTVTDAVLGAIGEAEKIPKVEQCDREVRQQLIRLVEETRYVKNIGLSVSEDALCTPVGIVSSSLLSGKPDRLGERGYKVWYGGLIDVQDREADVITVASGAVAVSTHEDIYSDVILPDQTSVQLYDPLAGKFFSGKGNRYQIPDGLLQKLVAKNQNVVTDEFIFSSRSNENVPFVAILSTPRSDIRSHWLQSIWLWLPLSLVVGLAAGFAFRNAVLARFTPEQRLRQAIERGEMKAFYQPIIDLQTRRCVGAEALVRWIKPDKSMVRPDLFIPLAEESGLVVPLTDAVLYEVVKDLATLLSAHDLYVSINLSARDIASTRFLDLLNKQLEDAAIPPQRIAIEATERGFLDASAARASMSAYRAAGHSILIDDFGTGYSSLSYLQELEVDVLKIDKSFVDTINADAVTSGVIPHIIAMATQLNLKIVAEGVENEGQAKYLADHGVQYGQGWLFAKAMPAEQFLEWLKTQWQGGDASGIRAVTHAS
jgi:sensor c-di-GMP phosphodiesterase-like protein